MLLNIFINGSSHSLSVREDAPLRHAIAVALHEAGQQGQPAYEWKLRDMSGVLLDQALPAVSARDSAVLYLNLPAGYGG